MSAPRHRRAAISLIEVIACTVLVSIMIVPVAGILRASGQTLQQTQADEVTHDSCRQTLRWVSQTLRQSTILNVRSGRLQLQLPTGRVARLERRRGELQLNDGFDTTVLMDSVRSVRFEPLLTSGVPTTRVGVRITLEARDPNTRDLIRMDTVVAEPSQY
ncbi:MAG: hypothetical protein AAGA03_00015 [Planctomycetota bacterium]